MGKVLYMLYTQCTGYWLYTSSFVFSSMHMCLCLCVFIHAHMLVMCPLRYQRVCKYNTCLCLCTHVCVCILIHVCVYVFVCPSLKPGLTLDIRCSRPPSAIITAHMITGHVNTMMVKSHHHHHCHHHHHHQHHHHNSRAESVQNGPLS